MIPELSFSAPLLLVALVLSLATLRYVVLLPSALVVCSFLPGGAAGALGLALLHHFLSPPLSRGPKELRSLAALVLCGAAAAHLWGLGGWPCLLGAILALLLLRPMGQILKSYSGMLLLYLPLALPPLLPLLKMEPSSALAPRLLLIWLFFSISLLRKLPRSMEVLLLLVCSALLLELLIAKEFAALLLLFTCFALLLGEKRAWGRTCSLAALRWGMPALVLLAVLLAHRPPDLSAALLLLGALLLSGSSICLPCVQQYRCRETALLVASRGNLLLVLAGVLAGLGPSGPESGLWLLLLSSAATAVASAPATDELFIKPNPCQESRLDLPAEPRLS
ncbi:MAG: hypothetical protein HQL31_11260 [Planctomycetes bacterium]|nr:hypothetical protein [Planctomycetota bacterium]